MVTQVVNALATTTKLTSSPNPSTYGTSVTFTATVSATTGTPTGTVSFYSCTTSACGTKTLLGTGTLSGGQATYATSTLPVGTDLRRGRLRGFGQLLELHLRVVSQVVNAGADDLSSPRRPTRPPTGPRSPSRHGFGHHGDAERHGHLLQLHHVVVWHQVLPRDRRPFQAGKATYSTTTLPVGTDYVEAVYAASGNYAGSTSNVVTQKVNQASTSLVLSASPNPSHFGQAVSLSAQTTPGTGPTGTVTFYQDSPPNGY